VKEDYVLFLLQSYAADKNFDAVFGTEWIDDSEVQKLIPTFIQRAFGEYGLDPLGKYGEHGWMIFEYLVSKNAVLKDGDEYSGFWYKLRPDVKAQAVDELLKQNPATKRVLRLGEVALERALLKIASEDGLQATDPHDESDPVDLGADPVPEPQSTVPASDRLVTLSHNQISEFQEPLEALVNELEADNGVPEFPGLRERILGQIKAGKELILAGQFKAYLLYDVLVKALNELIAKYGNETIKSLANALLGALVSQLFEGQ
jgi:hypothetical protein